MGIQEPQCLVVTVRHPVCWGQKGSSIFLASSWKPQTYRISYLTKPQNQPPCHSSKIPLLTSYLLLNTDQIKSFFCFKTFPAPCYHRGWSPVSSGFRHPHSLVSHCFVPLPIPSFSPICHVFCMVLFTLIPFPGMSFSSSCSSFKTHLKHHVFS